MALTKSDQADPNYLAEVVFINEILPHPNADKLSLVEVFGNTIVVAKDSYCVGEKVIYFPVESAINLEFLAWANLLDKPELNGDGKTKGFFGKHGRVKAIALRGIPSQGFLFKISKAAEFFNLKESDFKVGEQFDTINNFQLCRKYIKGSSYKNSQGENKKRAPKFIENIIGYFPRPVRKKLYSWVNLFVNSDNEGIKSRIVEGQFHLHYSTEQIGRNIWFIKPDDDISISEKLHGTSFVAANVLCKPKFSLFGRRAPKYETVYSSRNVIKNRKDGKYTDDVWGKHAQALEGKIPEGTSLYGEIVGWVNSNKMVQSNYEYGVTRGESELYIYRITNTDVDGVVTEFTWPEIVQFCKKHSLNAVPELYCGKAKDLFGVPVDEKWGDNFLKALAEKYLDKPCRFCSTGVVNEGIVVKVNSNPKCPVFKFKSPKFLIGESADRDKGVENIEEEN